MEVAPIQIVECKGLPLVFIYFSVSLFVHLILVVAKIWWSIHWYSFGQIIVLSIQKVPSGQDLWGIYPYLQHLLGLMWHVCPLLFRSPPLKGHLFGQKWDPSRRSKIALSQSGHCDWRAGQGATYSRIRAPWFWSFEGTDFRVCNMPCLVLDRCRSKSNLNMQVKVAKDPAVADNLLGRTDDSLF